MNRPILGFGMPSLGGPVTTAGGLVFYAGTQDYYLRAIDVATGEELWKGRLPVGAQATPMTSRKRSPVRRRLGWRRTPVAGSRRLHHRLRLAEKRLRRV
ncbi:exported hypothetical protein [Mesorhizobium sp. STM 4661]|nr:exported hypothetical protein [Mesorhizobium sp. STM 4661]